MLFREGVKHKKRYARHYAGKYVHGNKVGFMRDSEQGAHSIFYGFHIAVNGQHQGRFQIKEIPF